MLIHNACFWLRKDLSADDRATFETEVRRLSSFLESVPELAGKLPDPHSGDRKFEDVVKDSQQACVLVLVY